MLRLQTFKAIYEDSMIASFTTRSSPITIQKESNKDVFDVFDNNKLFILFANGIEVK